MLDETARIRLRRATPDDAEVLTRWDRDPDVVACTTDDPEAEVAFGDHDWREEIGADSDVSFHVIAEEAGRPVGAMQIIDPHREPTHYWGDVEPGLRALDVWIGDPSDRGRGLGAEMMRAAHALCFATPDVTAIVIDPLESNTRALRFYRRLGYVDAGPRIFDGVDRCRVMRLTRAAWAAGAARGG